MKLKYRLGQYVEARSLRLLSTSTFSDWALSCIFLGIPLGSFLSGIIIRRYYALRPLLRVVSVLNLLTYLFFAAGWIRMLSPQNTQTATNCLNSRTRKPCSRALSYPSRA